MSGKILNELTFEIIQKCPNNCIYCSSNSGMNCDQIISISKFKNVLDDAIKLGLRRLNISGGEPFLHPDLFSIIKYAKDNGVEVFVYTSGVIKLNNESKAINVEDMKQLKNVGIDKIIFNMQAISDDLYNKIMGTSGCLKYLKESIELSTTLGIYTEIHFVPMKINIENVEDIISFAKKYRVNKISFLRLVLQGRAEKNKNLLNISEKELNEFRNKILHIEKNGEKEISIRLGVPLSNKDDKSYCSAGWEKIVVKYNGDVIPCEAFKYIDYIGDTEKIYPDNINNNSLMSIWKNSRFLNILRNDIHKLYGKRNCSKCPAVEIKRRNIKL